MKSYIYVIKNKLNNKSYIGKSNNPNKRFYAHRKAKSHIGNALRKYGKENFLFQIIEECSTEVDAYFLEWWNIRYYGTKVPNGYNLNDGGLGGLNPSEETRKKISKSCNGRLGYWEGKRGFWAGKKRPSHTKETKIKMSNSHKKRPVYQINKETNEIIAIFSSAKEAADYIACAPTNITACCKGKIAWSHGFKWKYA